ncbi:MAG: hypothetical protein ABGZ53_24885 [Fuerstiella sp.]
MKSQDARGATNISIAVARTTAIAFFLSITFIGCSGDASDAPTLVDAHGKVTVDGSPVANARVMFVSTQGSPFGVTDASGNYTIAFNDEQDGAFPGETTVVVKKMDAAEFVDDPDGDDEDDEEGWEEKEEAGGEGGEWQIKVNVADGGSPFNFDLKSEDAGKTVDEPVAAPGDE